MPMRTPLFIVLLLATLHSGLLAAEPYEPVPGDPVLEPWRWRPFARLNGLGLRCLAEGPDRTMWFGTAEGVLAYDGLNWRHYNSRDGLYGDRVLALLVARNGDVWVGTDRGISVLRQGEWTRISPPAGAAFEVTGLIQTQEGEIWAATSAGALSLSKDGHHTLYKMGKRPPGFAVARHDVPAFLIDLEDSVYEVCEGLDGSIWFGLRHKGLIQYRLHDATRADSERWRYFPDADGSPMGRKPRLLQASGGDLWVVSDHAAAGVHRFDGSAWKTFTTRSFKGDRLSHYAIMESRDGTIWIGEYGGLFAYRDGVWTSYAEDRTPIPKWTPTVDLIEAADGAIWVAGLGKEAARLDYADTYWQTYKGLLYQCEDRTGGQWFLTWDLEAVRYDGLDWTLYGVPDGLMDTPILLFSTRAGEVWAAGSHGGVAATARFDGARWTLKTHPVLGWGIHHQSVVEASNGELWFGSTGEPFPDPRSVGGLVRFDGRNWSYVTPPEAPAATNGAAELPDGRLLVIEWGKLHVFDGSDWGPLSDTPAGLGEAYVKGLHKAVDGSLWISTREAGAYRFDGRVWYQHDVRTGLPDNDVQEIVTSTGGSVWAETGKGFARFDGTAWSSDSLPLKSGKLRQTRDGTFWISHADFTNDLLLRQSPGRSPFSPVPVRASTRRFRLEQRAPETRITLGAARVSQPGNTVLGWSGHDPWDESGVQEFSYRLDGESWSPFGPQVSLTLLSLPSGDHLFQVRARDRAFNIDPTPARWAFTVVPPVWKQFWFILLVGTLTSIAGWQTVRVTRRDRRLAAANKDLLDEMAEREQAERERARLDERLGQLQYLYRLRERLADARTSEDVVVEAGETLGGLMAETIGGTVRLDLDGVRHMFGSGRTEDRLTYERPLLVGDAERGSFYLTVPIALSESQERALVDETVGQITRTLEARELEAQLLQSARLVTMGQVSAGVAHELNQPLGAISTTAGDILSRLVEGLELSEEQLKEMMQEVVRLTKRMSGTVNQLRVFSKDTSELPPAPFSINDAVRNSVRIMEAQFQSHGIELTQELVESLPAVVGRGEQMEQVIVNLLANGRDAVDQAENRRQETGDTGARGFRLRPAGYVGQAGLGARAPSHQPQNDTSTETKKRVTVRTFSLDGRVVLEAEDNGVGMDEATAARVFEPFFTTKPAEEGTGLGLSISYAIVRHHDGTIVCRSRVGRGTIFRVELPATQ